ncbi:MAG TPA: YceI family protein [Steroidobacteraceae bacterium]|nr:polyisoprenoid-binding protein [Steroidobacteraceae bacterium]HQW08440.1 YceI family protein [Steroidobacteraceae bacterium]HQX46659.1 YceI family protein [Steroidobacteraceae bacterium]HQX77956.1 YceI family protein [Steroidobacteraceae bacterium]HQZ79632.1 YceI family protein [Steroidobacteraceae bacterium]
MRRIHASLILAAVVTVAGSTTTAADAPTSPATASSTLPAGRYTLDKYHASLVFRVDHLGFSRYTARFTRFDVQLDFDPAHADTAQMTATIDPDSLELDNPPAGFADALKGPLWLDTAQYPAMSYRSRRVTRGTEGVLRIDGDLMLHGITSPVTLFATFNGGYAGHPLDPNARIGFSAHGTFRRSAFGIAYGIPPVGSSMGVSDEVEVIIEAEFSGPPWAGSPPHAAGDAVR